MNKEGLRIKDLQLDGRIILPPVGTQKSADDGSVTEALLSHYAVRAKNPHVSMIITEHSYFMMQGKAKSNQLSIEKDADLEGLRKLVQVIHDGGAKAMCQLNHGGSACMKADTGMHAVAPSPVFLPSVPKSGDDVEPLELTVEQIQEIVRRFAEGALRAKQAGYDAVEIHSAHGYLLNQFYSPLTNQRTDAYGGDLDGRLKIHKEVIAAVRAAVGESFPIAIRLGGCDYREGGSTIEDAVYAARVFEECGVDLLDLSGGMCRFTVPGRSEPGYFRDLSEAVKAAVNVPVLLTGGVKTLADAKMLLEEGAADLIGVARALIENPAWEEDKSM